MKPEIRIYALELSPLTSEDVFRYYYDQQPLWRREKTDTLRRTADKIQSLGVGILLQKALPDKDLSLVRFGDVGKPYLPGDSTRFNLSHAGDWALCAAGEAELGCDIERMKDYRMNVAHRFFCPQETAMLESAPTPQLQQELFFRLWTLKESYLKAVGKGLTKPLNSFCVVFGAENPALRGLEDQWLLREYDVAPGYRCALCAAAGAVPPENVTVITI